MVDVIPNCTVTDSDARILKQCVMDNRDPLYKSYGGFHTGLDLETKYTYSLTPGDVIHVGTDGLYNTVIIALDEFNWCIYGHMLVASVSIGDELEAGAYIGVADRYVHFEYCNSIQSRWPVHVLKWTLFKQDPMIIIESPQKFGVLSAFKSEVDSSWKSHYDTDIDMSVIRMLRFNKGDDDE